MGGTRAAWDEQRRALHQRTGVRFARAEPRHRALDYVKGITSPCERKNDWYLAELPGGASPGGGQRLLNQAIRDADAVRDDLREYVVEHPGDPQAVPVLDETDFLKKGERSVGVQRWYSGTAGRIENCQVGVFLTYTSPREHAFLDRALYLLRKWAEDPERRRQAGVPEGAAFATKPGPGRQMLVWAFAAGVPAAWVTGRQVRADKITSALEEEKGPGAWQRLYRLQLTPEELRWGHWLLVRRIPDQPQDLAYYVVFAPAETTLAELVRVAGSRGSIESCFESAKGEFGLDQSEEWVYEVRRWDAWHRSVTLALLAHACVSAMRAAEAQKGALIRVCCR